MKGKELSLLKEIGKVWIVNSKDAKEKIIKDERVIIENNKILGNHTAIFDCYVVSDSYFKNKSIYF